ncbi:MAG: Malonyl CoA-acyl carrier protein transacylase [uncultured Thermomicrobiales bacterium]|uniref:Malonyl CoA-acyl carrier protein transacylase n=1 Tax=uncultured Thermomicrobiales bacterium TaxID=1645740 RepID=A0A6J4TG66_9BACT|nr:MAG: Malonyl CoA-acyl carrier protein transacylase [uncultured Thermomicrobiales bacterium]
MALRDTIGDRAALVFPGQGSQFVGMGRALAEASPAAAVVFAEADETLGMALSRLCWEGPATELEDTRNAQPAILTASVAALAAVRERVEADEDKFDPLVAMVAGHSLGEFSALVAAGALAFPDALRLVRERGRLMAAAGEIRPGGMAAVIGLDDAVLGAAGADAAEGGVVEVANANCPGQTVISGDVAALERAMALAKERGAKRVARLGVSIASHSPLMAEASARFADLVADAPLRDPRVPVVANADGQPLRDAAAIRNELAHQIERAVRWTESVQTMVGLGATGFVELGPGAVLAGLIKRIDRTVATLGVGDLGLGLPVDRPAAG